MSNRRKLKNFRGIQKQLKAEEPTSPIIRLEGSFRDGKAPRAICDCGWKTERSNNLMTIGLEAKAHHEATGHEMRKHH